MRNVYFIGHANRFFSWRVRLGSDRNTLAPSTADDQLRPHVEHYHQSGPRIRQDVHYEFLRDLARSMGTGRDAHVVEFRACAMADTTLVDTGVLMLFAAARGWRFPDLRVEFRGYRDFYSILPNSNGGFRTVIERIPDGHVIARAAGMGAPRPQLLACLSHAQVARGERCR